MPSLATPLVPKDHSGPLNVVAMGRISTVHQDLENIEASHRYIQDYLSHIYQGPMQITLLGEQASGMLADRATIRQAEELVAGGKLDLLIAEDLARIYRNPRHQYRFVQDCVDQGTRVICVGDNLDTADENWEVTMGAAALRHGLHIPDTRRRVRRTATHSFHNGAMVQKIRYGFRRLSAEEARSGQFGPQGLRIARRPECTPIIREMAQRMMRGDSYAAVADWLQSEGIEPGPYVESGHWTARLVAELLDDPILSGTRTFRDTICRPIFRTGKHKPVKNTQPETEHYPELAHLSPQEHEALRREIARRRAARASKGKASTRRQGVPRSRSIWPGQSATCAICGGLMYYAGKHLKCSNSLVRAGTRCWNRVQVPGDLTRQRVVNWLVDFGQTCPEVNQALVEIVWKELERAQGGKRRKERDLDHEIAGLERQAANLAAAIAEGGQLSVLLHKLKEVEKSLAAACGRREEKVDQRHESLVTKDQIEAHLREHLVKLLANSFDWATIMRELFPQFVIQPVQAWDSGQVRPRAQLILRPDALLRLAGVSRSGGIPDVPFTLDLFEPPVHIRYLGACLAAKEAEPSASLKTVARTIGVSYMTVKRAFDYARLMVELGTAEPYREVHDRPVRASRWRPRRRTSGKRAESALVG